VTGFLTGDHPTFNAPNHASNEAGSIDIRCADPQAETAGQRLDCLDPDNFRYAITSRHHVEGVDGSLMPGVPSHETKAAPRLSHFGTRVTAPPPSSL
jgi:hypothetical protein